MRRGNTTMGFAANKRIHRASRCKQTSAMIYLESVYHTVLYTVLNHPRRMRTSCVHRMIYLLNRILYTIAVLFLGLLCMKLSFYYNDTVYIITRKFASVFIKALRSLSTRWLFSVKPSIFPSLLTFLKINILHNFTIFHQYYFLSFSLKKRIFNLILE